eukprot:scaffold15222_cov173-Skeletonema_marinoi.AAC.8
MGPAQLRKLRLLICFRSHNERNQHAGCGWFAEFGSGAIGMASTVATRLSTGDTEVTLMKKQLWTENELVIYTNRVLYSKRMPQPTVD